jgi:hypothetical protein
MRCRLVVAIVQAIDSVPCYWYSKLEDNDKLLPLIYLLPAENAFLYYGVNLSCLIVEADSTSRTDKKPLLRTRCLKAGYNQRTSSLYRLFVLHFLNGTIIGNSYNCKQPIPWHALLLQCMQRDHKPESLRVF